MADLMQELEDLIDKHGFHKPNLSSDVIPVSVVRQFFAEKTEQHDQIISVSGFGVEDTVSTQCNYMLVGLTVSGKVLLSTGDGKWTDVTGKKPERH